MIFHDMYIVKTVCIFEVKALTIKSIFYEHTNNTWQAGKKYVISFS